MKGWSDGRPGARASGSGGPRGRMGEGPRSESEERSEGKEAVEMFGGASGAGVASVTGCAPSTSVDMASPSGLRRGRDDRCVIDKMDYWWTGRRSF